MHWGWTGDCMSFFRNGQREEVPTFPKEDLKRERFIALSELRVQPKPAWRWSPLVHAWILRLHPWAQHWTPESISVSQDHSLDQMSVMIVIQCFRISALRYHCMKSITSKTLGLKAALYFKCILLELRIRTEHHFAVKVAQIPLFMYWPRKVQRLGWLVRV